jgi:hypothetical protein
MEAIIAFVLMSAAIRYNNLLIDRFDQHDGIMTVTAIARAPGVLTYKNPDGSVRRELVSPDFLRRDDSDDRPLVAGLADIPVTREHPPFLLHNDAELVNQHGIGRTKNKVRVYKDAKVEVVFDVFDSQTQDDIRSGAKPCVSLGYATQIKPSSGVWNGQHYDAIQSEPFHADHLAVCAMGRSPDAVITRYDSTSTDTDFAYQDGIEHADDCGCSQCVAKRAAEAKQKVSKKNKGVQKMATDSQSVAPQFQVTVGGRPILLDSADDVQAINRLLARADAKGKPTDIDPDGDGDDDTDPDNPDHEEDMKTFTPAMKARLKKAMAAKKDAEGRADAVELENAELVAKIDSLNSLLEDAQFRLDAKKMADDADDEESEDEPDDEESEMKGKKDSLSLGVWESVRPVLLPLVQSNKLSFDSLTSDIKLKSEFVKQKYDSNPDLSAKLDSYTEVQFDAAFDNLILLGAANLDSGSTNTRDLLNSSVPNLDSAKVTMPMPEYNAKGMRVLKSKK